jgi:transposase-like protein
MCSSRSTLKVDVQRCVVHKVCNTLNKGKKKDQVEVAEDLKLILYYLPNIQEEVQSWESDLGVLLTFMDYPPIRQVYGVSFNEPSKTFEND